MMFPSSIAGVSPQRAFRRVLRVSRGGAKTLLCVIKSRTSLQMLSIKDFIPPAKLLVDIGEKMRRGTPIGDFMGPPLGDVPYFLYIRCIRLVDSIAVLLAFFFPEEGMILARSLFDDALKLAQLVDVSTRQPLSISWKYSSLNEKEGLFKEAIRCGIECDPDLVRKSLNAERKTLDDHRARLNINPRPFVKSSFALAKRFGRDADYFRYATAHEHTHGSQPAFAFSRSLTPTNAHKISLRTTHRPLVDDVAGFAARSAFQAGCACGSIFGWTDLTQWAELEKRAEALQKLE